jgi:uncharacterized protein (TIGR02217 family)
MTSIVEFKDSSFYNRKPLQLIGLPVIDSSQKVFGDASGYFPAGASVQYFHDTWQNLSANNWAWAFRLRFKATVSSVVLFSTGGGAANGYQFEYDNANHVLKFTHTSSAQVVSFAFTPSADVWYALALVRVSNKLHLYKDGSLVSATALNPEITDHATNTLKIGAVSGSANIFIDEFAFQFAGTLTTVDQASYSLPTSEFTPDANIYLYLKFNQVPLTFIESQFPAGISFGSSGGPVSNTNIVVTKSGNEVRNVNWPQPIRKFQAQYGIRNYADMDAVLQMHLVCQGKSIGFRFKDWSDFKSCGVSGTPAFNDQTIGTGDGSKKIFQLVKKYSFGGYTVTRAIKKPVANTVLIGINGAQQNSGWTVDTVNGLVYFETAPGNGLAVTAGYEFDVPVRFDNDELSFNLAKPQLSGTTVVLIEDMNENNR